LASAASADEPVKAAAPAVASATPRSAPRATKTVRVLSFALRPRFCLDTLRGIVDREPGSTLRGCCRLSRAVANTGLLADHVLGLVGLGECGVQLSRGTHCDPRHKAAFY